VPDSIASDLVETKKQASNTQAISASSDSSKYADKSFPSVFMKSSDTRIYFRNYEGNFEK
jgi:hypothetical protein